MKSSLVLVFISSAISRIVWNWYTQYAVQYQVQPGLGLQFARQYEELSGLRLPYILWYNVGLQFAVQ